MRYSHLTCPARRARHVKWPGNRLSAGYPMAPCAPEHGPHDALLTVGAGGPDGVRCGDDLTRASDDIRSGFRRTRRRDFSNVLQTFFQRSFFQSSVVRSSIFPSPISPSSARRRSGTRSRASRKSCALSSGRSSRPSTGRDFLPACRALRYRSADICDSQ